jgi:hypothetical protein
MLDREQIEVINRREELLFKAHALACRIKEQTRKLMQKHGLHARRGSDNTPGTAEAERSRLRPADPRLSQ